MKDLTGQRFGRLTALTPIKTYRPTMAWLCKCDCGNQTVVNGAELRRGRSKSCGCLGRELWSKIGKTSQQKLQRTEFKDGTMLCHLTMKTPTSNTSGHKGVHFRKDTGKWMAYIYFQGGRKHLGYYDKFEDAVKARERAEEELFEPVLNNHGRTLYDNA